MGNKLSKSVVFKHFGIPLSNICLIIYKGSAGLDMFNQDVKSLYPDWKNDDNSVDGMHYKNKIWIEDSQEFDVLFHEICHFLEWLYSHLDCNHEPEFKARIFSYVMCEIMEGNDGE